MSNKTDDHNGVEYPLSHTPYKQMKQAEALDKAIRHNLEVLGYGE